MLFGFIKLKKNLKKMYLFLHMLSKQLIYKALKFSFWTLLRQKICVKVSVVEF